MMNFRETIVPSSDQLNFEDVQTCNITAKVVSVKRGSAQQPVHIELEGYKGRPYKPSKSMRRVLIGGWGDDGHSWVGKYLELKGDKTIKFGGVAMGGIKIHGMSDIDGNFSMMLTESRGKRAEHKVIALRKDNLILADFKKSANEVDNFDSLKLLFADVYKQVSDVELKNQAKSFYDEVKEKLEANNGNNK